MVRRGTASEPDLQVAHVPVGLGLQHDVDPAARGEALHHLARVGLRALAIEAGEHVLQRGLHEVLRGEHDEGSTVRDLGQLLALAVADLLRVENL